MVPDLSSTAGTRTKRAKWLKYRKARPEALTKSNVQNAGHAYNVQNKQEATPEANEKTRTTTPKTKMHLPRLCILGSDERPRARFRQLDPSVFRGYPPLGRQYGPCATISPVKTTQNVGNTGGHP